MAWNVQPDQRGLTGSGFQHEYVFDRFRYRQCIYALCTRRAPPGPNRGDNRPGPHPGIHHSVPDRNGNDVVFQGRATLLWAERAVHPRPARHHCSLVFLNRRILNILMPVIELRFFALRCGNQEFEMRQVAATPLA